MRTPARVIWFVAGWSAVLSVSAQPAATERRLPLTAATAKLVAKTERISDVRTKLTIASSIPGMADAKLHDATGKEIPFSVSREGAIEAVVDPKVGYILSPKETKRQPLVAEGVQFPARYIGAIGGGTPTLGGLFLRPARVPLIWDDEAKAYSTELVVGYEFQDGAERKLPSPKTVTFFAEGSHADIQSDTVKIIESGGAGYQRVTLFTKENAGETLFTARAGPTDELKSSVSIRREPGSLRLTLPSSEIAAYGVGTGTLTVSLLARDGLPMQVADPMAVQLSSGRLRLPATVTLPANQSAAEVEFRSGGFGEDQITAESGFLKTTKFVRLVFPAAALVAALAGGALGGITRFLRNRRTQQKKSSLLTRRLIEGMLVGVIFVSAAWAGLVAGDFGMGMFGTPFGAFVLAALSGYAGCVILDRVTKTNFKGLQPGA